MTYLVTRFSTIGNVAMMVPVLSSLSQSYPEHQFVVVSKKDLHEMFYGLENVQFHVAKPSYGLHGIFQLYRELQAYHIDAVIDLHDVLRSKLLRLLFRIHHVPVYVIDYGRKVKRLITWRGYQNEVLPTEFERYQHTFMEAGLVSEDTFTAMPVNEVYQQQIRKRFGAHTTFRVGIAPFAKSNSNILPYRIIRDLIQNISQRPNTEIFLFGAGEIESEVLRQWASLYPHTISLAGQLPLGAELELMRELDVMLCMDSANQHLASLVQLRVVSVWTATHPALGFYGWNQAAEDCIQCNLRCRPCTQHGTNHCKFFNYACKNINIEDICQRLFH